MLVITIYYGLLIVIKLTKKVRGMEQVAIPAVHATELGKLKYIETPIEKE